MAEGYEYGNARVRAMSTQLLEEGFYEELVAKEDVSAIITRLFDTVYRAELEAALVKRSGFPCLAEALRRNFANTMRRIRGFYEGPPQRLIDAVLARWDVFNIKTILRGLAAGASAEEILDTILPAGELKEAELVEIARQPGVEEALQLLARWRIPYAQPLAEALEAQKERAEEGPDLAELELALDRFYYDGAMEAAQGGDENAARVRQMLEAQIDVANIMVVLRLSSAGGAAEVLRSKYGAETFSPLLISSGNTTGFRRLATLSASVTVERVLERLANTPYGRVIASAPDDNIVQIERELGRYVARLGMDMFREDPLGIATVLGYIWAKENEVVNLRIITRSKTQELSPSQIREGLLLA